MFVVVYLNNIVVYSKTIEEYIIYIKKVLKAIKNADLYIKLSKTEFYTQRVKFLNFIIIPNGI